MGWPPGKEKSERLVGPFFAQVSAGRFGLVVGVVAFPAMWSRIVAEVVVGVLVVVRAFEPFPPLEPETAFRWNEGIAAIAVDMPFADVGSMIAGVAQAFGQERSFIEPVETLVVDHHAVAMRVNTGHQRCPIRTAYGATGDRVAEVAARGREPVKVRCGYIRVAGVTESLSAPLVRENKDKIVFFRHQKVSVLVSVRFSFLLRTERTIQGFIPMPQRFFLRLAGRDFCAVVLAAGVAAGLPFVLAAAADTAGGVGVVGD